MYQHNEIKLNGIKQSQPKIKRNLLSKYLNDLTIEWVNIVTDLLSLINYYLLLQNNTNHKTNLNKITKTSHIFLTKIQKPTTNNNKQPNNPNLIKQQVSNQFKQKLTHKMRILLQYNNKPIQYVPSQTTCQGSYNRLIKYIRQKYKQLPERFVVKYVEENQDQEGDLIDICCDGDIESILKRQSNSVKVYIYENMDSDGSSEGESERERGSEEEIAMNKPKQGDKFEYNTKHQGYSHLSQNSDKTQTKPKNPPGIGANHSMSMTPLSQQDQSKNPSFNNITASSKPATTSFQSHNNSKQTSINPPASTTKFTSQNINPHQSQYQNNQSQQFQDNQIYVQNKGECSLNATQKDVSKILYKMLPGVLNQMLPQALVQLVPSLKAQINQSIQRKKPQSNLLHSNEAIVHDVECSQCKTQKIKGIRYKCSICPSYNLCQECENLILHQHHMLKMRFAEQPKKTNPQIQFTNKVFYLVEYFGGESSQYKDFVKQNIEKSQDELFEIYFKENGHLLKRILGEKLIMLTKKLGFYSGARSVNFTDIVAENPRKSFQELVLLTSQPKEIKESDRKGKKMKRSILKSK